MPISLYDATIPSYLQVLGAVSALVDKAAAFAVEQGLPPEELIGARLAGDMLPFAYQVKSAAVHSLGAIEGVRKGSFSPDMTPPPATFDGLKSRMTETITALEAVTPAEMEGFIGRDMCFLIRGTQMNFTAETFLLSFSQPNFYFHATTAYDILRWKGVQIGKRDFIGKLRLKV